MQDQSHFLQIQLASYNIYANPAMKTYEKILKQAEKVNTP